MKKIRVVQIIELVLLVGLLIGLIVFLSKLAKYNSGGPIKGTFIQEWKVSVNHLVESKEEQVNIKDINAIELDFKVADIEVTTIEGDALKILEKTSKRVKEEQLFTVEKNGDKLIIEGHEGRDEKFSIRSILPYNLYHKIELGIPKQYASDIILHTISGDIMLLTDLKGRTLTINQTSGDFNAKGKIEVDMLNCKSISGDILLDKVVGMEHTIKGTSGDISIGSVNGRSTIETKAGDISVKELIGEEYTIESISGSIKVESVWGKGEIKATSGDIDLGYKAIEGTASLDTLSGDVHLKVAEDIAFIMEAKATAGDIGGNIPITYAHRKENKATAQIGDDAKAKFIISTLSGDIDISREP